MNQEKRTVDDVESEKSKRVKPLWANYAVTWLFMDRLCGSVPGEPDLVRRWLDARRPSVRPAGGKSIDETQEEVLATLLAGEEEAAPSKLVFQRREGGLVVRAGTIRAHIKDCARKVSSLYVGKIEGERSFASRVVNGVYTDEHQYWIPILDAEGQRLGEASGVYEKPVHAIGPRGQQLNSLKVIEYIDEPRMDFKLKVLGDCVPERDLRKLFTYGAVHGYGGERGDGEGKYTFDLKRLEDTII